MARGRRRALSLQAPKFWAPPLHYIRSCLWYTRKALRDRAKHDHEWGWGAGNAFGRWDWSGEGWKCYLCGERGGRAFSRLKDYTCPACRGKAEWGDAGPTLVPQEWGSYRTPLHGRAYEFLMNTVWRRWFHTAKAILLVWANRWLYEAVAPPEDEDDYYYEGHSVDVAVMAGGSSYVPGYPTEYWWETLKVGYGWRRWWVLDRQDST